MSDGSGKSRKYSLICNGELAEDRTILLKRVPIRIGYNNSSSVKCASPAVISIPLSIFTDIIVKVKYGQRIWHQSIQVDLKKWHFTVQPYYKDSEPIPGELAQIILSSFGIRTGNQAKSLATLGKHPHHISDKHLLENYDDEKE